MAKKVFICYYDLDDKVQGLKMPYYVVFNVKLDIFDGSSSIERLLVEFNTERCYFIYVRSVCY